MQVVGGRYRWMATVVIAVSMLTGRACPGQDAAANLAAFDKVWETIRDSHWDPQLNGVDWNACREELRPSEQDAENLQTTRAAISNLLQRLGQSHFGLIPREVYDAEEGRSDATGWIGIEFRFLNGDPIVTRVAPASPAAAAGVSAGWKIVRVGTRSIDEIFVPKATERISEELLGEVNFERLRNALHGQVDDELQIVFEDNSAHQHTVSLVAQHEPGEVTKFGGLPAMAVDAEAKMLSDGIGYFRLNLFLDPTRINDMIRDFFAAHRDEMQGLIIDIRGNPGGLGGMAMALGGWLAIEDLKSLGEMQTRQGGLKFICYKRPKSYTGPIAILVDEQSMSTAEIFAGGMQFIGRARIFGRPTPGKALPSVVEKLPNDDQFIHAIANYALPDGTAVEGRGVIPDEPIMLDRVQLAAGVDQDVVAASQWIRTTTSQ